MTADAISPDLKATLRRLKLSRILDTLPDRLVLARQQKMPHQDLLLLVLSDEVARRESLAVTLRVQKARLDNSYEAELRKIVSVDLLLLDDFAIDVLDATESRDLYEILLERYRTGSIVVTSNRGPDEWLATFADPIRAQSAIDRFTSNAYDLVIDGESYRPRLKPRVTKEPKERTR